jgi:hypothetical protein
LEKEKVLATAASEFAAQARQAIRLPYNPGIVAL